MVKIQLNGSMMTDREAVHVYLKEKLSFPDYYGGTLDALWDLLSSDFSDKKIEIFNAEVLMQNLGEYGGSLLKTFCDAAENNKFLDVVIEDDIALIKRGISSDAQVKVIAVNGSPRKEWNTATLLKKALDGAASCGAGTKLIHLYDLNFKGCISCFACKFKNNRCRGLCAVSDDISGVFSDILEADVLILGSPIYIGNVTGEMRSFMERLVFPLISYNSGMPLIFTGKVRSGFIYTMNATTEQISKAGYEAVFNLNARLLERLNGTSEFIFSADTLQFDDYSQYEASRFDAINKAERREKQFPLDCQSAFEMGVRLAKG